MNDQERPRVYTGPLTGDKLTALDYLEDMSRVQTPTAFRPGRLPFAPETGDFEALREGQRGGNGPRDRRVRHGGGGGRGRAPDRGHRAGRGTGPRRLPRRHARRATALKALIAALAVAVLLASSILIARLPVSKILIGYWFFGATVIAACMISYVKGRRFTSLPIAQGKVLAIIPAYNEDPESLAECVRSLLNQTVPPDRIIVVDDGSRVAALPSTLDHRTWWIRQTNKGKRGAHVTALKECQREGFRFIVTVDSDSRPHPDALEHLLRAMSNRKVQAATGWLYIRNYAESWVARAADIDIGGSCVMMRASRTMLGGLETTSGALAIYRSEILFDNLEQYAIECGTGDDRWLAMRARLRGLVVGVEEARVDTDMPPTLKGTFRQRLRWARSWWWMIPFAYARLPLAALISPTYGLVSLAITPVILGWTIFALTAGMHERLAHPWVALAFLGSYVAVRYALSALYLVGRPGMSSRQKLISLLFGTPAAVILNVFLLAPTRYWALLRLQDNRWRTREAGAQT